MTSYAYRVKVNGQGVREPGGSALTWTHATATEWARKAGVTMPSGTTITVERVRKPYDPNAADWLPHRTYVVGADGIVRRTDR